MSRRRGRKLCVGRRTYVSCSPILFRNVDLTLALAGRWRPLRAWAGRGGSGRAPGWCGWEVASLLLRGSDFLFLQEQIKGIIIRLAVVWSTDGLYAVALWRGCRSTSASAWGPFWSPVPRLRLRPPRPPGGGGVGFPLRLNSSTPAPTAAPASIRRLRAPRPRASAPTAASASTLRPRAHQPRAPACRAARGSSRRPRARRRRARVVEFGRSRTG
jgi:hypothetical protein